MAKGLAGCMGFDLMHNFRMPFTHFLALALTLAAGTLFHATHTTAITAHAHAVTLSVKSDQW